MDYAAETREENRRFHKEKGYESSMQRFKLWVNLRLKDSNKKLFCVEIHLIKEIDPLQFI